MNSLHIIQYRLKFEQKRKVQWFKIYTRRKERESGRDRREGMGSLSGSRSDDPIIRRDAPKNLSYSLTGRAIWRCADTYLVRGGWLDGTAGFHYSLLISMYENWIELKMRELEQAWTDRTDRTVADFLAEANPA